MKTHHFALFFFVLVSFLVTTCQPCDIYIASKCPSPPAFNERYINSTLYCKGIKDYVDCINKKLKLCKNVQEYGPALETIKWNIKVLIDQGRNHGCLDLNDKIKLPRIPRKKPTTTSKTTRAHFMHSEKEIIYVDPECNQNIANTYCQALDYTMNKFLFDESLSERYLNISGVSIDHLGICQAVIKYKECMEINFYIKCQKTFADTFIKLDRAANTCMSNPKFKNSRGILNQSVSSFELSNFWRFFNILKFLLIMLQFV